MLFRLTEVFFFFIGFITGVSLYFTFFGVEETLLTPKKSYLRALPDNFKNPFIRTQVKDDSYNTSLATYLYENVKIGCIVLTQPKNHKKKAQYAKSTWAYKCHKLIFLSTVKDDDLPSIVMPFTESRDILWGKIRGGFSYAYHHWFDEVDWFLKADDDS